METIIIEFEKVTKYPLTEFLTKYRDFMANSYPAVNKYFSGEVKGIESHHLRNLEEITTDCKDVMAQFKNFANKFSNCGYWELMDYIDDLNNLIEKINKLPKFRRTSLTKKGYQPFIQVSANVGGYRTVEDIADTVKEANNDNTGWAELMTNNDMDEGDWEIDELTNMNVFINNKVDIVVTTILDMPIGERIYGKDISRKINFIDNDLEIVEYKNNVEQKCNILLELNRGDVPENSLFGKNSELFSGVSIKQFSYPELIRDIQNNFMQNDLFEYVEIRDFEFKGGDVYATVEIKTKYDYKTKKKIEI